MLDIKVESVDGVVTERTGVLIGNSRVHGTKRVPQKVGKPSGLGVVGDLTGRVCTTNGQHEGLAHGLTDRDVIHNLMTAREQIRVGVLGPIALVSKVGAGIGVHSGGKAIDEGEVDDVEVGLRTKVPKTLLVRSLALEKLELVLNILRGQKQTER